MLFNYSLKGQEINFNYIDSMSYQYYLNGDWDSLLAIGKLAEKENITFPNLSMRLGYASLIKGNNSLSLKYYYQALEQNSYNQDALYYAVLNNTLLSRRETASFLSKNLNDKLKLPLHVGYKKLAETIDFETSIKPTNTELRKTGQFYRIGLGNRINYRWNIFHSISSYRQNILISENNIVQNLPRPNTQLSNYLVKDFQYYLKSEYHLNRNFSLINAFHFTYTNFDNSTYNTSIINCGLKYLNPFADIKLEISSGVLIDSLLTQVALSSIYHPKGNLNFYGGSRLSFQKRTNLSQVNFSQMLGIKLNQKVWLEMHGTFGQIKNFIDKDAFYIYDALDAGNYRIGASVIIAVNSRLSLTTNYYYEQKKLYQKNSNYNLHSFTLGLSWKL